MFFLLGNRLWNSECAIAEFYFEYAAGKSKTSQVMLA